MKIRRADEPDFIAMWPISAESAASETSYVFAATTTHADAFAYWFSPGIDSYVAEVNGQLVGMYRLVPNYRDLGAHVANASFMVKAGNGGNGVGMEIEMVKHCLREA